MKARGNGCASKWCATRVDKRCACNPCSHLKPSWPPGGWRGRLEGEPERGELFLRLAKAEAQLLNLVRRWPGVIFTQRPDFSFQFVSPQVEALTGIGVAQWHQTPALFWQVIHEADTEALQQQLRRAADTGESAASMFRIRNAQTGKVAYVLEHRQAVRSSGGLLLSYEGVWLDITRQTIAEKRLSAAAWKETLAMLTMGLAHDFNNVLAGILSLSESFLAEAEAGHPFAEGLKLIRQNSAHASQLVHRIMSLHRSKTGERNYHDLNEVITEFTDLVEKILPRRITVTKQLATQQLPVYADSVELRQVVLNLALNAADAMPDRGQLTLRTSHHDVWPAPAHFVGTPPRLPCVCFEIADTGCGIPARHLPSLFDPFFTTKPVNKGSGLGLFNARLALEKHHGGISVESVEGQGTTFRVWLPQADFTEAERAEDAAAPRRSILLLGEPGLLLEGTVEFLRSHGYYVVKATDADQARDVLNAEESNFAALLVLADASEPAPMMFAAEARRRQPALKIILQITGGTADEWDTKLTAASHLTIAPGMSEADILTHLDDLLRRD